MERDDTISNESDGKVVAQKLPAQELKNRMYVPKELNWRGWHFYSLEERLPKGKQATAANAARLEKNEESADTFLFGIRYGIFYKIFFRVFFFYIFSLISLFFFKLIFISLLKIETR